MPLDGDGAGATLPLAAALLGPGQPQVVSHDVQQTSPGIDVERLLASVDPEADLHHPSPLDMAVQIASGLTGS